MKAAVFDKFGGQDVLRYANVPDPPCPRDGVLIRVEAIAIEGGDLINRASMPPPVPSHGVGYAAAGKTVRSARRLTTGWSGRRSRVSTWTARMPPCAPLRRAGPGSCPTGWAWRRPQHCRFHSAPPITASSRAASWSAAKRCSSRAVLAASVLPPSSSLGQAGAKVIAAVSGAERLARRAALGFDHAIDHRRVDVASEVMRLTNGQGVDLAVDPVGSTLKVSLPALRPEGRLVFVGNAGGSSLQLDLWPALQSNPLLLGVFTGTQFEKPAVHLTVSTMLAQAAHWEIEVVIDGTFALEDAAEAHAYAEDHSILGRVVLVP